jgi:hypothetical protein
VDIHTLKKRQSDNLRHIPGGDVPPLADSA